MLANRAKRRLLDLDTAKKESDKLLVLWPITLSSIILRCARVTHQGPVERLYFISAFVEYLHNETDPITLRIKESEAKQPDFTFQIYPTASMLFSI